MEFASQFKTLTRKNLLLKGKNKCGICCEIVFPLVIIGLLFMILGLILSFKPNYDEHNVSTFPYLVSDTNKLLYIGSNGVNGSLTVEEESLVDILKLQVATLQNKNISEVDEMFLQFTSTEAMELYFANNSKQVVGGVVFENTAVSGPTNPFKYSIRLDSDEVNDNSIQYEKDERWSSDIYYKKGFSSIQVAVDQSLFLLKGLNQTLIVTASNFPDPWTETWEKWINGRKAIFYDAGSVFITASLFIFAFRLITELVIEKETKIREGMKMMGLNTLSYFISWLVTSLVISLPTTVLIFLILRGSAIIYHTGYGTVFFLFVFYLLTLLLLGFIFSLFFDKSKFAGIISYIVVILLSVAGIFIAKAEFAPGGKYILSLISPIGMACAIYTMAVKDLGPVMTVNEDYLTTEAGIVGMFLVDIVIYVILLWYLDNVVATEFGTKRKWYFPFTKSYWFPKKSQPLDLESSHNDNGDFEMVPVEFRTKNTVSIRGLTKEYKTGDGLRVAVDGLSLDFFEDQIHSYLGHNGSGKSTTIGMLTGLTAPTSGDAVVGGYSIIDNLSEVRKIIGVCPQHDILWERLTVLEHLEIYASLKGVSHRDIKAEASKMAIEVGLQEKMNAPSSTLSGGQKRKLCLGIAFIGRSKVIFIDEATSGMDPLSRRGVWDFLLKYKKGRTIVLTTHFMDEADFLGDRISIISHGKLKCDGSSLYLKNRFGCGYLLTCSKISNACITDSVTNFVHQYIPDALILSDVGTELSYRLPTSSLEQFVPFFRKLDEIKLSLGIEFYGISVTTLEEVFLRIGNISAANEKEFNINNNNMEDNQEMVKKAISNASTGRKAIQQLKGLLIKRIITSTKDLKAFILTILLPLVVIIGSIIVYKKTPMPGLFYNDVTTPLTFSLGEFGEPVVEVPISIINNGDHLPLEASSYFSQMKFVESGDAFNEYLVSNYNDKPIALSFISNLTAPQLKYNVYFGLDYLHPLPVGINLVHDALLRNHADTGIQVTSKPFNHVLTDFQAAVDGLNISAIIYFILLFMGGYALMAGAFAGNISTERTGRIKRLLYISGCKKYIYWMSNLIWDYFFAFILLLISSIVLAIVEERFKTHFGLAFISQIFYCIAIIPLAYLFSYKYSTHGKSLAAVFGVFFGMGVIMIIATLNVRVQALIDQNLNVQKAADILDYIFFVTSPLYCLAKVFVIICEFTPVYRIGDYEISDIWVWNYAGAPLFFLAAHAVIWTLWIMILDYMPELKGSWKNPKSVNPPTPGEDEDSDVRNERQRLLQANDTLMMSNLHKLFPAKGKNPAKAAVFNSTLGIPKGQTFGLLGMNGAGKTTTLSMLSGDIIPTAGSISINNHDLITQRSQALESIGSCPQFDSLVPLLSAREQLVLYSRIKGVPEELLESTVEGFISMMDLKSIGNSNCGGYSGGNKRKVSLSIAMLGGPSIVYLDECSTGCDPAVRRFIWNVVSELSRDKVIILTTHSMEECEALCQRITIMKDGKLTCLGSNQHIKSKFGSGYSVDIKFKKEYLESGIDIVLKELKGSTLLDKHDLIANFELKNSPQQPIQVSEIFAALQNNLKYLLDDFSVSQLSLEQVFLKLTGSGYEERLLHQSEIQIPENHPIE